MPGDRPRVLRQENRRRIRDLAQALLGHREDAELVHGAEAVLERAHEPESCECGSPSKYSTVSTMCSSTRGPAMRALLRHVADEQHDRRRAASRSA